MWRLHPHPCHPKINVKGQVLALQHFHAFGGCQPSPDDPQNILPPPNILPVVRYSDLQNPDAVTSVTIGIIPVQTLLSSPLPNFTFKEYVCLHRPHHCAYISNLHRRLLATRPAIGSLTSRKCLKIQCKVGCFRKASVYLGQADDRCCTCLLEGVLRGGRVTMPQPQRWPGWSGSRGAG